MEYGSTAAAIRRWRRIKIRRRRRLQAGVQPKNMDLKLLADSIQQEKNNCTRFIIIGPKRSLQKRAINSHCMNYRIRVVHCTGFCPIFFITI
ncbi:MAG: prephenate dehydratase domain-containing protein [Clostridium sp.]